MKLSLLVGAIEDKRLLLNSLGKIRRFTSLLACCYNQIIEWLGAEDLGT